MPNRILRAELLESEAWLSLKDNADRAAWLACFLTVDNFGSMPAGPHRLVKLWRPYGIDTPEKAAKCLVDLVDVDLLRRYEHERKPYLHIPRFKQNCRFLGHLWPISPWATDEEKQSFAKKSQVIHRGSHTVTGEPPLDVDVDVDVDVDDKSSSKTLVALAAQPSLPDPIKKTPKTPKPATKGTRLPLDWRLPEDWLAWAILIRPDWTSQGVVRESLTFRDFWHAKAGAGGVKMDWLATWRTWIRRAEHEPTR